MGCFVHPDKFWWDVLFTWAKNAWDVLSMGCFVRLPNNDAGQLISPSVSKLSNFLLKYLSFCKKFLAEIRIFFDFLTTSIDELFNQHWEPVCNFHGILVHGTMLTFVCIF